MNAARSSGWRSQSTETTTVKAGGRLDWDRDGIDWPNRAESLFVQAGGITWHLQKMGVGPTVVLVHGTGATTHSWRDLATLLAPAFTVVMMDLPGHGFTDTPPPEGFSLPGMAAALTELLAVLGCRPDYAVGHSAGAAILARMCLDRSIAPLDLVSVNGAFIPFGGVAGRVFAPLAKALAGSNLAARFFAWNATDPNVVDRLLRNTGSALSPRGTALYRRLARNPVHLSAALSMMANWDLVPLLRDLGRLPIPLALVVGSRDGTVSPAQAEEVVRILPTATIHTLPGLGHLAHEERPADVATLLTRRWNQRMPSCS